MKKILLGLLVIAMVLALTACSQETYSKLAENMGKMSNNVYGIEANMADVDNATSAVSASVAVQKDENGAVTGATIDFTAAAKITESVASIKDSGQKTEALKEELAKPVASSEAEQVAIQTALQTQATTLADDFATLIAAQEALPEEMKLKPEQVELLETVHEALASITISENPTMAELTTVAVLSEMANTVQIVASAEDTSAYVDENGLTDEGMTIADSALSSLDTLKMTSEVAGMDLLGDVDIMALINSMNGGSKEINGEVLKYLAGFKAPIATIAKLVTNPITKRFDPAKYNSLVAQARAIKMSYDLLSALYVKPAAIADVDAVLAAKTNHGLIIDDLIRYIVALTFVSIDKVGGQAALEEFVNAPGIYDALMDIEHKASAFESAEAPDGFASIWNNLLASFMTEDGDLTPYALRSLSTLSILLVDTGYKDLLYLGGNEGTISGYLSMLNK
ncbi:MAG: hypothetical protein J5800_08540 [Spirochaetales bacterium]|nr:hypothetical protein [Spirochaetales bacterium]